MIIRGDNSNDVHFSGVRLICSGNVTITSALACSGDNDRMQDVNKPYE